MDFRRVRWSSTSSSSFGESGGTVTPWERGAAFAKNFVFDYADLLRDLANRSPCLPADPMRFAGMGQQSEEKKPGERWLSEVVKRQSTPAAVDGGGGIAPESPVFINAWNEWGEGNHLEPDQKWGRAYLEAWKRRGGR